MTFEKSAYGYWIDPRGRIHPVTQQEEHSGWLHDHDFKVGNDRALELGWVRVSLSTWSDKLHVDFVQPLTPARKEAIYWIAMHHNKTPWDENKDCLIEAKRMSVIERLLDEQPERAEELKRKLGI